MSARFCARARRLHLRSGRCRQSSPGRVHRGAPHTDGGRKRSTGIPVTTARELPPFRLKSAPGPVDRHGAFRACRKPAFRATCGPTQISGDVPEQRRCGVSCCQTSRRRPAPETRQYREATAWRSLDRHASAETFVGECDRNRTLPVLCGGSKMQEIARSIRQYASVESFQGGVMGEP